MATLDTLAPQRRAIIELLLRQGQGYEDVASMLDMPPARVRELAREALGELAPSSARRVDGEWRDQVADYVLRQQTGPESKATRGHLKHSEPARTWVSSLVDSLDSLYGDAERPEIPEAGAGGAASGGRKRSGSGAKSPATKGSRAKGSGAKRAGAAAGAGAAGGAAAGAAAARSRKPAGEGRGERTKREPAATGATPGPSATREASGPPDAAGEHGPETAAEGGTLSPEARKVVRRRRIVGGAVAVAALVLVLAIILVSGGSDESERAANQPPRDRQQAPQAQLVGQARLERVGRGDAEGVAVIAERSGEFQLLVQARGLEPSGRDAAYEVWLYNSQRDAVSLGGQVTDNEGNLQGAGPLPANFRTYRFVDISREKIDRNPANSGDSVLRVPMADLLRPPAPGGAGAGNP